MSLAERVVFVGFLVGGVCRGLALFLSEQRCFELALLGAIAGGFFVARTVGAKC
jgi:hypothetical protein